MTSLADELMNDLDSDMESDVSEQENGQDQVDMVTAPEGGGSSNSNQVTTHDNDDDDDIHVPEGGVRPATELNPDKVNEMALGEVSQVDKVAKLAKSSTMRDVLQVGWCHILGHMARELEHVALVIYSASPTIASTPITT